MTWTTTVRALVLMVVLGGCATAGTNDTPPLGRGGGVHIYASPPLLQLEVRPAAPARGMVWVPGFWDWNVSDYRWIPGRWARPRPGLVWTAPAFPERDGAYVYVPGRWEPAPRGLGGGRPAPHTAHTSD